MVFQELCAVDAVSEVADKIFVLAFRSPRISEVVQAGQFLNLRTGTASTPLLRRPFSVYRVEGSKVQVIFNVVGSGTSELSKKRTADTIDVLGPLGVPFHLDRSDFQTALLVAGGLGVAPFPLATTALRLSGKSIRTFLGARTAAHIVKAHLENVLVATDDGSLGYSGNVVDLLKGVLASERLYLPKIFACGPTAMLRALAAFVRSTDIPCEVSLEGPMACGIGICQGCPVELSAGDKKYALMCTDGPTFDVRTINL